MKGQGGIPLFVVALLALSVAGKSVGADQELHHVILGTHPSDLSTWSSPRIFTAGDHIWFRYGRRDERMVEVESMEEYLSCDVSNPIKMYTDKVYLHEEGNRYLASSDTDICKQGFKLHVHVQPQAQAAAAPTSSASTHLPPLPYLLLSALFLAYPPYLYILN